MQFNTYAKVHNDICIIYNGYLTEYIVQLDYILPFITDKYKDISISLYVCDELCHLSKLASPLSSLKKEYGLTKTIKTNPNGIHPVYDFIKSANLPFPKLKTPITQTCSIYPNANFPNKSLTKQQLDKITYKIVENADWVIGAENEHVFRAGIQGKRVTLIPTGQGTELFKMMFPHGELWN
jgi:hypothetical protein